MSEWDLGQGDATLWWMAMAASVIVAVAVLFFCHGHTKPDAGEMKRLIEQFQSAHYRGGPPSLPGSV